MKWLQLRKDNQSSGWRGTQENESDAVQLWMALVVNREIHWPYQFV